VLARFSTLARATLVATAVTALAGCTSTNGGSSTAPTEVTGPSASVVTVAGTWTGTYRVTNCAQHGGGPLVNMCAAIGASYPFTLELQQQGPVVTGRYALANVWFDLRPAQVSDDRLTLQGAGRIDSAGVLVDVTWLLSLAPPAIGGTAVLEWTADAGGGATLHATLIGRSAE
jgi:hypothetical protein